MGLAFHDLDIWKEGHRLLELVYDATTHFPREEMYALTDQIRRSSNSIIANIAEAHGRYHFADKIRVLYVARGELSETRSHLRVAHGRRYLTTEQFSVIDLGYRNLEMRMNGYIRSLRTSE